MFSSTRPLTPSTEFQQTDLPTTLQALLPLVPSMASESPTTLSPSLLLDLQRYGDDPVAAKLLPVVAASVRHGKALSLAIEMGHQGLSLTLHPRRQVYYCEVDLCSLPDDALSRISLREVQPDADIEKLFDGSRHIGSLRPLLWHLALRGAHAEPLPELAGPVRCRVTLGVPLSGLPIDGATRRLIQRMKFAPVSIDELMPATMLSRASIQRIWNALYLQSALMVSRAFTQ